MESLDTPITVSNSKVIHSFAIQNIIVQINSSATINILCFDVEENNIGYKSITIEHDDYVLWGNDDTFILNYVKDKLALIDTL
jgi:hypothetical protein